MTVNRTKSLAYSAKFNTLQPVNLKQRSTSLTLTRGVHTFSLLGQQYVFYTGLTNNHHYRHKHYMYIVSGIFISMLHCYKYMLYSIIMLLLTFIVGLRICLNLCTIDLKYRIETKSNAHKNIINYKRNYNCIFVQTFYYSNIPLCNRTMRRHEIYPLVY